VAGADEAKRENNMPIDSSLDNPDFEQRATGGSLYGKDD
jgi:hypothetical protein